MNFQEKVTYLTTTQREFIPFYTEPCHENELPFHCHVRVSDKWNGSFAGKTGVVVGYEQPPTGWVGWHWILWDGNEMPEHYYELPKIHRDYLEVIE